MIFPRNQTKTAVMRGCESRLITVSCEENWTEKGPEKITRDSGRCPQCGSCCQVRMICPSTSSRHTSLFGVYLAPAASSENRPDLFQHSGLQDMDCERVVILILASPSLILLLSLVVEWFNHDSTQVLFWICVLAYFSDPDMRVSISQKGSEHREKPPVSSIGLSWVHLHLKSEASKKLQPALQSPSTNSPMSILLHGSFWLLLSKHSTPGLARKAMILVM